MPRSIERQKAWYQENKNIVIARCKESQRKRIELIHRIKTRPCADCHIQYNPWQMQFDHRDPRDKLFTIAEHKNTNLGKVLQEIEKCDIVCANCHAERTHNRNRRI